MTKETVSEELNETALELAALPPSQGEGPAADVVREIWDAATNAVCQTMQDRGVCNCRDGHCVAAKIEPAQQDIEYFAALASLAPRAAQGAPADEQSGETSHVAVSDAMVEAARN